jgi:epoxyqueuosine reductase QueG
MAADATALVRQALGGTGIELVASCAASDYDARAPAAFRSAAWLPEARGVIVAGSAGPALWRGFMARMTERPGLWSAEHPYDAYAAELLARADQALTAAGIRFQRFDAAYHAPVRVDFLALATLVGLGAPGPFALLIHPEHGPWWALRGAWIVDAQVDPVAAIAPPRCAGCAAPCVGGWAKGRGIADATPEVRSRCVVGQASRYDDDQIAYHYDRPATAARLAASSPPRRG